MTKPSKIGVTGGIGAGKSLVCEIFAHLGVPVYNSDDRAKWLMAHDLPLREKIMSSFGPKAYKEGQLNRQYLAQEVFNDPDKLALLNSLVHPVVKGDFDRWVANVRYPYCIKEAALLFESGSYKDLDMTILVFAPESIRIQRVLERDPFRTEEEVKAIIQKQMDEEEKRKLADQVIINDGSCMVLPQVLALNRKFESS